MTTTIIAKDTPARSLVGRSSIGTTKSHTAATISLEIADRPIISKELCFTSGIKKRSRKYTKGNANIIERMRSGANELIVNSLSSPNYKCHNIMLTFVVVSTKSIVSDAVLLFVAFLIVSV